MVIFLRKYNFFLNLPVQSERIRKNDTGRLRPRYNASSTEGKVDVLAYYPNCSRWLRECEWLSKDVDIMDRKHCIALDEQFGHELLPSVHECECEWVNGTSVVK